MCGLKKIHMTELGLSYELKEGSINPFEILPVVLERRNLQTVQRTYCFRDENK